jgi:hypothetical protein
MRELTTQNTKTEPVLANILSKTRVDQCSLEAEAGGLTFSF